MLSEQKKLEQLEKVLNSQEFKDSKSYKNLLKYLVEASLKNEIPTESSIAINGLGKNENFDQTTDASVRVYIHNLRKKLASYYLNEGKFDAFKIAIPKGQHYQIQFVPITTKNIKKSLIILNAAAAIILIAINLYFWLSYKKPQPILQQSTEQSIIWDDFRNSKLPTLIVFGDFFIFKDTSKDLPRYIRDFRINSLSDLETLKVSENYNEEFLETELTFLGKSAIDCFQSIYKTVLSWGKPNRVILSSELTWDDITSNNVIFIGSFKTLRLLNDLIVNLNSSYRIHPNTIFYKDTEVDSLFEYRAPKDTKTGYLKDYALVAKLPGPNNNSIIIFTGTHDIGQSATVNSFLNKEFLSEFEMNFDLSQKSNLFFEGIFEVQGFERTGFHPKMIHFHKLPADFKIQGLD